MKKKTNYIIAAYYDGEEYLDECCLLGWNGREDYYCTDFYGNDILTPKGNVKKNDNGLIWTSTHCSVYVGETYEDCEDHAKWGNREELECVVCKIEKDQFGDWKVLPVENTTVSI